MVITNNHNVSTKVKSEVNLPGFGPHRGLLFFNQFFNLVLTAEDTRDTRGTSEGISLTRGVNSFNAAYSHNAALLH